MSNPVNRDKRANGSVSANNDKRNRSGNSTSQQLIESLKNGEPSAYNKIMEQKSALLKNFINKILQSNEDSEEVTQDVFIFIWEHKEYLAKVVHFDGFLFNLAYSRAINRLKERERFKSLLLEEYHRPVDYADSPEYITEWNEAKDRMDKAIADMPKMMRLVYTMKFIEGYENNEIAQELSITTSTVRTQIERAIKRINDVFS